MTLFYFRFSYFATAPFGAFHGLTSFSNLLKWKKAFCEFYESAIVIFPNFYFLFENFYEPQEKSKREERRNPFVNTRDLQIFLKIADYNSITRAAEDMQMSQPAVSSILKRLEEETGHALFSRKGKWLIVNEQGKLFYRSARKFLEEFSHVQEGLYLGDFPQAELVFRICRNSDLLYAILGRFAEQNSDIRLVLQRGSAEQQENFRKADFTVSLEKEYNRKKRFLPLEHRAALYAMVPKKNPLSARNRLTLEDLLDQSFVFLKNSDDSIPEGAYQACLQMGFRPRVSVFVDSNNSKYSAIRAGCGIGLAFDNELSLAPRIEKWRVIPVLAPLNVEWIGISWSEERLTEAGTRFLTFVEQEVRGYGY
mgnify:FL=1